MTEFYTLFNQCKWGGQQLEGLSDSLNADEILNMIMCGTEKADDQTIVDDKQTDNISTFFC